MTVANPWWLAVGLRQQRDLCVPDHAQYADGELRSKLSASPTGGDAGMAQSDGGLAKAAGARPAHLPRLPGLGANISDATHLSGSRRRIRHLLLSVRSGSVPGVDRRHERSYPAVQPRRRRDHAFRVVSRHSGPVVSMMEMESRRATGQSFSQRNDLRRSGGRDVGMSDGLRARSFAA